MINSTEFPKPTVIVQNVEICFPVYTFDLSNNLDLNDTISKIKNLKSLHPNTTQTNVVTKSGWRSPYLTLREPETNVFVKELLCIQQKLNQINSFETNLFNMWAVIYGAGDFSKNHNHFTLWDNLAYNTILYLTDSSTPLLFETTESKVEILPKKGLLVVMHPLVMHSVPIVNDNTERTILVCNWSR